MTAIIIYDVIAAAVFIDTIPHAIRFHSLSMDCARMAQLDCCCVTAAANVRCAFLAANVRLVSFTRRVVIAECHIRVAKRYTPAARKLRNNVNFAPKSGRCYVTFIAYRYVV